MPIILESSENKMYKRRIEADKNKYVLRCYEYHLINNRKLVRLKTEHTCYHREFYVVPVVPLLNITV